MRIFENKKAVVTGGASGIGKALVRRLLEEGAQVAVIDKSPPYGPQEFGNDFSLDNLLSIQADITLEDEVQAAAQKIEGILGTVEMMFNNAGVEHIGTMVDTSADDWDRVMDVNVKGIFLVCKNILPLMIAGGGGSVVNVSSISGILGWPASAAYCTSKGAVMLLTKQMAVDYGRHNIRVNAVAPGTTKTPMIDRLLSGEKDLVSVTEMIKDRHPLKRFAEPREIAEAMLFLASEEASFITGAVLPVDGGYTSK